MTNPNRGGTSAEMPEEADATRDQWEHLQFELADYLVTAGCCEDDNYLIVELTDPDPDGDVGCTPYAQIRVDADDQTISAEISGNDYLRTRFELGDDSAEWFAMLGWTGGDDLGNWQIDVHVDDGLRVALAIVVALRDHFGIAHPQMLTYRAWGPAQDAAEALGLCLTDDVPVDEPTAPSTARAQAHARLSGSVSFAVSSREELLDLVECVLRTKYDDEPTLDEDGDFVLDHLGQAVWVRARTDQPAVEIMARVAHDVHSLRSTAVEIGLLNRDHAWVRWTLRGRMVWQTLILPASPFVPSHLDAMLDLFMQAVVETRNDLAQRIRAEVG